MLRKVKQKVKRKVQCMQEVACKNKKLSRAHKYTRCFKRVDTFLHFIFWPLFLDV
jgi:hypothetical protein